MSEIPQEVLEQELSQLEDERPRLDRDDLYADLRILSVKIELQKLRALEAIALRLGDLVDATGRV